MRLRRILWLTIIMFFIQELANAGVSNVNECGQESVCAYYAERRSELDALDTSIANGMHAGAEIRQAKALEERNRIESIRLLQERPKRS